MTNTKKIFQDWENIFHSNDIAGLNKIIDSQAIFFSPVVFKPQVGKKRVNTYLIAAMKIFKNTNFNYCRKMSNENETFAEFTCNKMGIEINGIDIIKNNNTHITEFKVFLRPFKAIEVVWEEMRIQLDKSLK